MAQVIKIKRSAVPAKVPATTDLALGELAMNTNDGTLFMKKSVSGTETIVQIGGATGSGETNTASNLGAGVGLYDQKVGADLQFKSLVAGSNVTLTDNGTSVTVNAASGGAGSNPTNSLASGSYMWQVTMSGTNVVTTGANAAAILLTGLPAGWTASCASGVTTITHTVGRPPISVTFWIGTTSTTTPLFVMMPGGNPAANGIVRIPAGSSTALSNTQFIYTLATSMGTIANGTVYVMVTF